MLHGFALSMLVPDQHYRAVSDWINGRHLGARVVYYRVAEPARIRTGPAQLGPTRWPPSSSIKDTPFAVWLEHELAQRADPSASRRWPSSAGCPGRSPRPGQVKGKGGQHEKDDRRRIDDRAAYVLGWSNERKIDALVDHAGGSTARLEEVRGAAN